MSQDLYDETLRPLAKHHCAVGDCDSANTRLYEYAAPHADGTSHIRLCSTHAANYGFCWWCGKDLGEDTQDGMHPQCYAQLFVEYVPEDHEEDYL